MFPAYPEFENLPLRFEVQWRGAARLCVAQLEQWPDSDKAVLICEFEDADEGAWIMMRERELRYFAAPKHLLQPIFGLSGMPCLEKFSKAGTQRLSNIVQRAFAGSDFKHGIARLFLLTDLPSKPRIVVATNVAYYRDSHTCDLYWCPNEKRHNWIPFQRSHHRALLRKNGREAHDQLQSEWQNQESDAHFSWKWCGLSHEERFYKIFGSDSHSYRAECSRAKSELQRFLRLILIANEMWGPDEEWQLYFELGSSSHMSHEDGRSEKNDGTLHRWNSLLLEHLLPGFRHDLYRDHLCVRESAWWNKRPVISAYVSVKEPPSAHEQLEAKLYLREWLQDKATPDEIEQLLWMWE